MAFATYEYEGRRRMGLVQPTPEGDLLIPVDGLTELGRDTTVDVLRDATPLRAEAVPVADVRLCPVVPNPDKIVCVGLNYLSHVGETGRDLPTYPVLFTKFPSALIGANDDIMVPPEWSAIDYEVELAVVIGREGRRISRVDAPNHVLGYTVATSAVAILSFDVRLATASLGGTASLLEKLLAASRRPCATCSLPPCSRR